MAIKKGRPKPLKRRVETRPELRTFLVFCEGDKTEPDYLNGLKRLPEVRHNAPSAELNGRDSRPGPRG
jgi:hypothetical protein